MDSAAIRRLAETLVDYSTEVKKGQRVLIQGTDLARPLVEEIYRLALRRGAYPTANLQFGSLNRIFFTEASDEQLDYLNPIQDFTTRNSDVLINILSSENTRALTGVDPSRQQRFQRTMYPLRSTSWKAMSAGASLPFRPRPRRRTPACPWMSTRTSSSAPP